jgi:hypothetical protein
MNKKIGIIEVCEPNHYSAINGLMKTYAVEPTNQIYIFTMNKIAKALRENGLRDNIHLIEWDEKEPLADFLKRIEEYQFDRVHYSTILNFYKEFLNFTPKTTEIYFHVHNIDDWFNDSLGRLWKVFAFNWKNNPENKPAYKLIGRFALEAFLYKNYREKLIKKVNRYKYQYIVHSSGQKQFMSKFVPAEKITIFPFAIYEYLQDGSGENKKLRVCIPGIASNSRRDYDSLFKVLLEKVDLLKDKMVLDLLGFIPKNEENEIVPPIKSLISKGLEVLHYFEFVYGERYDNLLSQCDILLNNQKVNKSPSQIYGVTKESGMLFNMIRGCKPGVLPSAYPVDQEFHASAIFFDDYEQLGNLLVDLVNHPEKLQAMKSHAAGLSEKYSPKSLYPVLMDKSK